ncbi:FAS1-like dehydratase domain-containing protein [Microbacterium tumbae]
MTLAVGDRLPEYGPVVVSSEDSVRWAAASGDFTPFHFDPQAAADKGFAGPVVHGPWKAAVLRGLVRRWMDGGVLRSFSVRYLRADLLGEPIAFGGSVAAIERTDDGALQARLDLWVTRSDGSVSVAGECVATVPERLDELPLERLREAVRLGRVAGVFTYEVTAASIARFLEAVTGEKVDPASASIAPATYYAALDPVERRDIDLDAFLQDLPFPKTGGGNAFNEITYVRPIRAGDVVTVTTRYTEVYEKSGSRGTLLFRVRENELTDVDGAPIGTSRCGHVLSFDIDSRERASA